VSYDRRDDSMKEKLKSIILNLDDIIAGICVSFLVLITVYGVVMRYVIGKPLQWTEEVSLALIVWVVFIGASSAMKRASHISIDFFVDMVPQNVRKFFDGLVILINLAVVIYIIVLGYQLAMQAGGKLTAVLLMPYTYIDISAPIGGVMMLLTLVRKLFNPKSI
jgi:TRAP-type C4-dicarboxylate transport system permease small subunit